MNNKKIDILTDIETIGRSIKCPIIQIAAKAFNRETKEECDSFNVKCNLQSLTNGSAEITVNLNTLKWWLQTNPELLLSTLNAKTNNCEVVDSEYELIKRFVFWINAIQIKYNTKVYLWGNGILFDNRLIKEKIESYDLNYPIFYRNDRDLRTLIEIAADKTGCKDDKEFRDQYIQKGTVLHDAFDDVRNEYEAMQAAWKIIY